MTDSIHNLSAMSTGVPAFSHAGDRERPDAPRRVSLQSRDTISLTTTSQATPGWTPRLQWDALRAGVRTAWSVPGQSLKELQARVLSWLADCWAALTSRFKPHPSPMAPVSPMPLRAADGRVLFGGNSASRARNRLKAEKAGDGDNPFLWANVVNDYTDRVMGRRARTSVLRNRKPGNDNEPPAPLPKPAGLLGQAANILEGIPVHNLDEPVAVIDIGSSVTKLVIVRPGDTEPYQPKFDANLVDGQTGIGTKISPQAIDNLTHVLRQIQIDLAEQGVQPENVRVIATAAIRHALDQPGSALARQLGQVLDQEIEIATPLKEATYVYQSVLRDLPIPPRQKVMVVEVGSGSTEFAFGQGPRQVDSLLTRLGYMPFGSKKLGLENAFSPVEVALARNLARATLQEHVHPDAVMAAGQRPVFLNRSSLFKVLEDVEVRLTGNSLFRDGLSWERLDWYLSPEGLKQLEKLHQSRLYHEYGENTLPNLVGKLVILAEAAHWMGIETYQFGNEGGMKAGILDAVTREQVTRRMNGYADTLHAEYRQQFADTLRQMELIFPGFADQIIGRVKDRASIADKLSRKAVRGKDRHVVPDLSTARKMIGDGHGLKLVLEDSGRRSIEKIRNQLIKAVLAGRIRLLEINNYRGIGPDAQPYFTSKDVERLRLAAERMGQEVIIRDGQEAIKPSGYTTTQFAIQLLNPENGTFDGGAVAEFQVRGHLIDKFAGVEHMLYDIEHGKNVFKVGSEENRELRTKLVPLMQPLIEAFDSLNADQYRDLRQYLGNAYRHFRWLEEGLDSEPPRRPESLPAIFDIESLTGIYERYDTQLLMHVLEISHGHEPEGDDVLLGDDIDTDFPVFA